MALMRKQVPSVLVLAAMLGVVPVVANAEITITTEPVKITVATATVTTHTLDGVTIKTDSEESDKREYEALAISVDTEADYQIQALSKDWQPAPLVEVKGRHILTGPPGKYAVFVVAAGEFKIHPVELIGETEPPPAVGDFAELAKLSAKLARDMGDLQTQQLLHAEYSAAIGDIKQAETVDAGALLLREATERALAKRAGASRFKDWHKGYRQPLNAEIDNIDIDKLITFVRIVLAIIEGLKSAAPSVGNGTGSTVAQGNSPKGNSAAVPTITMHTYAPPNKCEPCERWIREQKPFYDLSKWKVVVVRDLAPTESAPQFTVCDARICFEYGRTFTVAEFNAMVEARR